MTIRPSRRRIEVGVLGATGTAKRFIPPPTDCMTLRALAALVSRRLLTLPVVVRKETATRKVPAATRWPAASRILQSSRWLVIAPL
jgi:hypothetical protein